MSTDSKEKTKEPSSGLQSEAYTHNVESQKEWYRTAYRGASETRPCTTPAGNPFADHFLDCVFANRKVGLCLEIGAGTGILTERLLQRGCKVVAVELSPEGTAALRSRFQNEVSSGQLQPLCADAINYLTATSDCFDLIIGAGVLHHIEPNIHSALFKLAFDKLNAHGQLAFGPEPCADGMSYAYWKWVVPCVYNLLGIKYVWEVECGTSGIRRHLLLDELQSAGFNDSEICPYQHFPVSKSKILKNLCIKCLHSKISFAVFVSIIARK